MTDSPVPLHPHPDLSIDQQLALRTASTRLHVSPPAAAASFFSSSWFEPLT